MENEQSWTSEEVLEIANNGDFGISEEELGDIIEAMSGY